MRINSFRKLKNNGFFQQKTFNVRMKEIFYFGMTHKEKSTIPRFDNITKYIVHKLS